MTQLTIVTTPTNSGDGTPLATAFNYCNSNFSELYARFQVEPPPTLIGVVGDVIGMYAVDSSYFYYCFANYDGSSTIWGQVNNTSNSYGNADVATFLAAFGSNTISTTGNITSGTISATGNITSAANINGANLTITGVQMLTSGSELDIGCLVQGGSIKIGNRFPTLIELGANTTNAAIQVGNTTSTINIPGTVSSISVSGNVTANYFIGNGSQLSGINANYGNSNVNTLLATWGSNTISTTGNVTANYFIGNGSQLSGLPATYGNSNVNTLLATWGSNTISTTGNITGGNIKGISASVSGTVTGTSLVGIITTASQPSITSVGTLSALSVSGNITSNNIKTSGTSGNITGANVISAVTFSASGNVAGNYILGNGSQLTGLPATYSNSNVTTLLSAFGSNTISTTGTITGGNITGGNVLTGGIVSSTGNVTGGNITTVGNVVAQGIVSASGNIVTAGYFVGNFAGNITGNLVVAGSNTQVLFNTNGNVDAVAGLTYNKGSNTLTVLGIVSSQGNVIGGNLTTAGQVSATGNITGNYILGNGSQLTGLPATYGNANVATFLASFGSNSISTTGNITSNNIITSGTSGNITGANIISAQTVSATGNITGANATVNNITVNSILSSPLQTKASTATGTAGQVCWDANYIYVCTATNTWKRVALTGGY